MNSVVLVGNLGADPELRQAGDKDVCNFRIATSEYGDKTEWHSIVVWGNQAQSCGQYLSKGSKVAIHGRLQTRQWEDKEGNTRYTTEIVANNVEFLSSGNSASTESGDTSTKNRGRNRSRGRSRNSATDFPVA